MSSDSADQIIPTAANHHGPGPSATHATTWQSSESTGGRDVGWDTHGENNTGVGIPWSVGLESSMRHPNQQTSDMAFSIASSSCLTLFDHFDPNLGHTSH